jgi:hypothetical protein
MRGAWLLTVVLALGGCVQQAVKSLGPSNVQRLPRRAAPGVFVQAGTELRATLNDPIGSAISWVGQPFTATIATPVRGSDKRTFIDGGAVLRGKVVSIGREGRRTLTVRLDSVETRHGLAPLIARIVDSGRAAELEGRVPFDPPLGYTALSTYPYSTAYGWGYRYAVRSREVVLEAGAQLRIELLRPLIAPR